MAKQPEARLIDYVRQGILRRYPTAWVHKEHGSPFGTIGTPDLLVSVHGCFVALEVKVRRGNENYARAYARVTPAQRAALDRIKRSGAVAGMVTSPEEALELIGAALAKHGLGNSV